ncbi:MAG: DUF4861 family protein [Cyclobacteriaceae bacterium]
MKKSFVLFNIICSLIFISSCNSPATTESKNETISKEAKVFARFVPERNDDFAWENDKIAFRAYGPASRKGTENNGFDCWLKRVEYPIINNWYANNLKGIPYHEDHGEGLDNYHVGHSAGCGGTGIWINNKREGLEAYTKYEIIESSDSKAVFKLSYEHTISGVLYNEVKTITIELGKRMFDVSSVFFKEGKPASNLDVCIGVSTHDGNAITQHDEEKGIISAWETMNDNSELGTAVVLTSGKGMVKEVTSEAKDESHIFLLTTTDSEGKLSYSAGYGWNKAKEITSFEQWTAYLANL